MDTPYDLTQSLQAFKLLLDLRIVSKARHSMTNNSNDLVEMSIETQYRCAGFIQAEVERYAAGLSEHSEEVDDIMQETVEDDSDLEDSENEIGGKRGKIDQPKKPKGTDVTKVAGKSKLLYSRMNTPNSEVNGRNLRSQAISTAHTCSACR